MRKIYLVILLCALIWGPQIGRGQVTKKPQLFTVDVAEISGTIHAFNSQKTIANNFWSTSKEMEPGDHFNKAINKEMAFVEFKSTNSLKEKKAGRVATVITNANLPADFFRSYIDGGEWNIAGNWQYSPDNGITPWEIATLVPGINAAGIIIRNGYNITSSGIITADDISIESGAALTINGGSFTLNDGAAIADLQVDGNLTWSNGAFIITGAGVSFEATATYTHAISFAGEIPAATWNPASACIVTGMTTSSTAPTGLNQLFGNFTWNCNQTSSADNFLINNNLFGVAGTFAINNTGGAYVAIMGATSASFTNTVNNIEVNSGTLLLNDYNSGGGYATLNVTGDITVADVSTARVDFAGGTGNPAGSDYVATLNLAGNLTVGANAYFSRSNTAVTTNSVLFFNGTAGTQMVKIGYGSNTSRGRIVYNIHADAVVQLKNYLWMWDADTMYVYGTINTLGYSIANTGGAANTAFYSFSGSTLITSLFNGFTAVTNSGAVQTNTRVYSSAADYEFRGYNTGDFTTITTPLQGTVRNLTINYFGVTMTNNITVTGALMLFSGQLTLPSYSTLTLAGTLPAPNGTIDAFSSGPSTIVLANSGFTINDLLFSPAGNLYYFNNNPPSGINTLQGNFIIARTLTLSGGILDNGNNSLTLGTGGNEEPLVKINGTLSMDLNSSLTFGRADSDATIPDGVFTSGPSFANLKMTRGDGKTVTLGNQGMELYNGLDLKRGTLNIGNSLLNLNGAYLDNSGTPGGYLAGTSTSNLTVTGYTGGKVTIPLPPFTDINLRTVTVGGARTLAMAETPVNNINLYGTLSIETQGIYDNGGESQLINASGSAAIFIDGTFVTRDMQGFTGTDAAVSGINPVLNPYCTIEYGYAGDQDISIRTDYQNIRFTGGGIKKPVTTNDISPIAGTVIIPDATTVNTEGNIFGSAATNFTMFNGRFVTAGSGIKPDMNGAYNLTGGVVEFAGTQSTAQTIQTSKSYLNIEVSGNNVGKASGNVTIKSGGSFIVKSNGIFTINEDAITGPVGSQLVVVETDATFKCGNADGFNGGNNTSVKSDVETINLNAGSILEYARNSGSGNQVVTSGITYQQVIMSGLGVKNLTTGIFALSNTGSLDIKAPVAFDAENGTAIDFNNRKVQIRSTVAGTGSLGDLTGVNVQNVSDAFSVERFMPDRRAWRLITAPLHTTATTTISAAWQNGLQSTDRFNPVFVSNGIGTSITNGLIAANGYDAGSTANASIKYFAAGNWIAPSATTIPINTYPGYMLFVRGDRQMIITNQFATPTITTLIAKGRINIGTQNPITAAGFQVVGNPYPSAIDFKKVIKSGGLEDKYYLWDPKLGGAFGAGAFVSFLRNGTTYDQTLVASDGSSIGPSTSTLPNDGTIESGAAFMVNFGASGTLQIHESAKINTSASAPFGRPANPVTGNQLSLRTNLAAFDNDSSLFLVDGVLTTFSAAYNNDVDVNDAIKIKSFAENIGMLHHEQSIAIERRKLLTENDTIFLQLSGLKVKKYRLELETKGIANGNLAGYLEDTYLTTRTAINMAGFTSNDFMPQNIPASSVPYRFRIVFKKMVTYNTIKAYKFNNAVAIDWSVTGESDIKQYEIERSKDGVNFTAILTSLARGDNKDVNYYNGLDEDFLTTGTYYYRIKSTSNYGAIGYSALATVTLMNVRANMYVYPNPVSNGSMGLQMNSMPAGIYHLRLLNSVGQILFSKTINHGGGTASFPINYPLQLKGNAELEITGVDKKKTVLKVIVE